MRRFLFVIISLLSFVIVKAQEPNSGVSQQNVFHGEIVSKEGNGGIADGYVLLILDGKIFKTTVSDKKGHFSMKNVPDGNYIVEVTCLGYLSVSDSLKIKGSTCRNFQLTEEAKELGEDEKKHLEKEIQEYTDEFMAEIDMMRERKEKELSEI